MLVACTKANENKQPVNIVNKKLLTSYLLQTCVTDQSKNYGNICGKIVNQMFSVEKSVKVNKVQEEESMKETSSTPQRKLFPKTIPTLRRRVGQNAGDLRHNRLSSSSIASSCQEKTVTNAKVAVLDDYFLSSKSGEVGHGESLSTSSTNCTPSESVSNPLKNLYIRRNRSGVCYQSGDVDLDLHDDMHLSDIEEQIISLSGGRKSGIMDTICGEL